MNSEAVRIPSDHELSSCHGPLEVSVVSNFMRSDINTKVTRPKHAVLSRSLCSSVSGIV